MPRRLIRKFTDRYRPAIDRATHSPWVRRYAPALADPDLWHLNRRSTARAVAIGLFCGLIPGPIQIPAALAACLFLRANLPLSIVTTFYTNPLTIVPLYLLAYRYGAFVLHESAPLRQGAATFAPPPGAGAVETLHALLDWMIGLGPPLALGIVLLATTLSMVGWLGVHLVWRTVTVVAWRRRARLRARGV
jgi:uncharacterized protein